MDFANKAEVAICQINQAVQDVVVYIFLGPEIGRDKSIKSIVDGAMHTNTSSCSLFGLMTFRDITHEAYEILIATNMGFND